MTECYQCGDEWPRDKMLSLDGWADPPEEPDCVCLRCASVAMKGGPENITEQERAQHNIDVEDV